ncbi:plasmid partitioning protein RepB [Phyllobacterium endophyticum]|jgi:ParB family chromosome partitioning protein|uniref:Plasmid partitioning protein RepB n=2 Tax=Phyllobacterium endophyticum TaxID=1149773 RepID=A0A2P7ANW7_9HYPH|nr:plasmid partitioning protein RepB [Phyllobacterium endophyticum]PSH55900.1 plasmid partitioning protein RepB [Phyllobacterium endophyticum]TXR47246.1 plasmid partitioning protein RepB [Phyllobacterium endophyticum]TYR41042.1 plasmid partitioning protein RepB [Phyllobacterium endophyticum]
MNKRRDALKAMMTPINEASQNEHRLAKPAQKSGSLKAMGLSLQSLSDDAEDAQALREQLQSGEYVVDIDPKLIDASFIRDRLEDIDTADFEELKASIEEHGQQVPILVRPHPQSADRYQVAYGHRRLAALQALGRPVKAVVRDLSDEDLIVAQGKENLERKDLSFIERALFAARLEAHGIERQALMAALSVHKGNLSTMIAVANSLPLELIEAIGAAPKVGRPRWEQLSQLLRQTSEYWKDRVDMERFMRLDSNARFALLLKSLTPKRKSGTYLYPLKSSDGVSFAQIEQNGSKTKVTVDEAIAPEFGSYLITHLPDLYAAYLRGGESEPRIRKL